MHITHVNLCLKGNASSKARVGLKIKGYTFTSGHLKLKKNNYCIATCIVGGGERWKNGMEGFDKKYNMRFGCSWILGPYYTS